MIILSNYNDPYQNIVLDSGNIKIVKLKDYKGGYDQGIAAIVGKDNDILGIFVNEGVMYLVKNNQIVDLSNKQIVCTNNMQNGIRKFDLKINDRDFYNCEYEPLVSMEDMILGDDEIDNDFLLSLSNILSSKENIEKFSNGFSGKIR